MSYVTNDPQQPYGNDPTNDWVAWLIILLWAVNLWLLVLH